MSDGRWRLSGYGEIGELGVGAQGRVVLARREADGQQVAIKYLVSGALGGSQTRSTFRNEAALLKRVANPHVARILDYVETPDGSAIVLEAVSGNDLRAVLRRSTGPLSPEASLSVLKGSLLGLGAAHSVGVVHRDYKPANVLVQADGQSKLIDFGIAVLTGQGDRSGSPPYMAPEQWGGEPASPATDLYAATCVFVECCTGSRPFSGDTTESLRAQHLSAPVPVERLPAALGPLISRGLAKSPADRFWSTDDFVAALETVAVREYGPDWQRRGLLALGSLTAALGFAVPLAAVVLAPGASGVGSASGGIVAGGGKGVLAKVGGAKGAVGIGGAGVAAITAAVLLWPSGPRVGGEARGSFRLSFDRPSALLGQPNMPPAESPYMGLDVRVTPARVRAGTPITLTLQFQAKTLQGVKYLPDGRRQCFGEKSRRADDNVAYNYSVGDKKHNVEAGKGKAFVMLFRSPPSRSDSLPSGGGTPLLASSQISDLRQPYDTNVCGFLSQWTEVRKFSLPKTNPLKPGHYVVSPNGAMEITKLDRQGVDIPPESVGARLGRSLPVIEVLKG